MINDILHIIHTDIQGNDLQRIATNTRAQNYLEQCAQQKIKFQVVDGVRLHPDFFNYWNINLAHKKVIQIAKDKGYPNVIIAEDDIIFTSPGSWDYFLSKIPDSYDIFCGLIYAGGNVTPEGRIGSPFSGGMTLYSVSAKFYDVILTMPGNVHIDRWLGEQSPGYDMFACIPYVCKQLGGYSFNQRQNASYLPFEEDKTFY